MSFQKRSSFKQAGFTLIELIIVIVVIGILAAVAIPQFTNISTQASQAATQGVAGAISSSNATNFAVRSGFSTQGVAVSACDSATAGSLLQGGLPAGYSVSGTLPNCVLTNTGTTPNTTAAFTLTAIN